MLAAGGLREGDRAGIGTARNGCAALPRHHDGTRFARDYDRGCSPYEEKHEPRCAVLRFATALRLRLRVQDRAAPGGVIATKAAYGARPNRARTSPMTTNRCSHDGEHTVDLSPTAHLLDELQLFGHRPFEDEPDSRPLPEPNCYQRRELALKSAV